ncbi:hypothetical protein ACCE15_19155 [Pseudomonas parafulva]|uniref:hypothetical protein n=1 Tax=Pseudomonas parafulva TaxID=157782 RepID=UPI003562CC3A
MKIKSIIESAKSFPEKVEAAVTLKVTSIKESINSFPDRCKVALSSNKYLIQYVAVYHCAIPALIALAFYMKSSSAFITLAGYAIGQILMLTVTASRIVMSENLKNELLENVPKVEFPDYWGYEENKLVNMSSTTVGKK